MEFHDNLALASNASVVTHLSTGLPLAKKLTVIWAAAVTQRMSCFTLLRYAFR